MEQDIARSPSWWFHGQSGKKSSRSRATLLLLDRADDPLTPLMHEYTYQAMVNDHLTVSENGAIQPSAPLKGSESSKEARTESGKSVRVSARVTRSILSGLFE